MFGQAPSLDTSPNADVFIIPPVIQHVVESDPLEEVALFRDEMANLVWGVERIIQAHNNLLYALSLDHQMNTLLDTVTCDHVLLHHICSLPAFL